MIKKTKTKHIFLENCSEPEIVFYKNDRNSFNSNKKEVKRIV